MSSMVPLLKKKKKSKLLNGESVYYCREWKSVTPLTRLFQHTSKMLYLLETRAIKYNGLFSTGCYRCWGKGKKTPNIYLCVSTIITPSEPVKKKRESVKSHLKSLIPHCYYSSERHLDGSDKELDINPRSAVIKQLKWVYLKSNCSFMASIELNRKEEL